MLLAVRRKQPSSVVIILVSFDPLTRFGRSVRFVGHGNVVNKSFVGYRCW